MSRIGNEPINIPEGIEVSINKNVFIVKGKNGELSQSFDASVIDVAIKDNTIRLTRKRETKGHKSKHGMYRALFNNLVLGIHKPYKIEQELVGVGYRASNTGQDLELALGFSHNIVIQLPEEVKVSTVMERGKNPIVTLESIDKQLIGQVAAKIRSIRKPEPYKGKGVRFLGEHIRRKAGKSAAK